MVAQGVDQQGPVGDVETDVLAVHPQGDGHAWLVLWVSSP
jgi:hypothetical protein